MSQEPRVRLVKDGNVVGIVWEDNNGDLVLEESEAGNELRVTSVSAAAEIIDADELRANDTSSVTLGNTLDADNNDIQNVDGLDSHSVSTEGADIVSGDIAEAVNRATEGDTILLSRSSESVIGQTVEIDVPNVEIHGGKAALADSANTGLIKVTADNVHLHNPILDGNRANNDPQTTPGNSLIQVTDCVGFRLFGGQLDNSIRHGVSFNDQDGNLSNGRVFAVDFGTQQRDAVSCHSITATLGNVDDIKARFCTVEGSVDRGGMEFNEGARDIYYTDNRFKFDASNRLDYGIAAQDHAAGDGSNAVMKNLHARRNLFRGPATGVSLETIESLNGAEDIYIHDNDFVGTPDQPINGNMGSLGGSMTNLSVSGNTYEDCVKPCLFDSVKNLSIDDATYRAVGESGRPAIWLRDCPDATLSADLIKLASEAAIRYEVTDGSTLTGLKIGGVKAQDCATGVEIVETSGTIDEYQVRDNHLIDCTTPISNGASGATSDVGGNLT